MRCWFFIVLYLHSNNIVENACIRNSYFDWFELYWVRFSLIFYLVDDFFLHSSVNFSFSLFCFENVFLYSFVSSIFAETTTIFIIFALLIFPCFLSFLFLSFSTFMFDYLPYVCEMVYMFSIFWFSTVFFSKPSITCIKEKEKHKR